MADNTEEQRQWLQIISNEFMRDSDISQWPDEMIDVLRNLLAGINEFCSEIENNQLDGADTNEHRAKSLLKHIGMNRGGGKPNSAELSTQKLLSNSAQNHTLQVELIHHNIPYTSTTIEAIANTPQMVEDIANAFDPDKNLPMVRNSAINQVASLLGRDCEELGKTVYKKRKQLYSLPEFQAYLRIHST